MEKSYCPGPEKGGKGRNGIGIGPILGRARGKDFFSNEARRGRESSLFSPPGSSYYTGKRERSRKIISTWGRKRNPSD
jgi:hypothetical protein